MPVSVSGLNGDEPEFTTLTRQRIVSQQLWVTLQGHQSLEKEVEGVWLGHEQDVNVHPGAHLARQLPHANDDAGRRESRRHDEGLGGGERM